MSFSLQASTHINHCMDGYIVSMSLNSSSRPAKRPHVRTCTHAVCVCAPIVVSLPGKVSDSCCVMSEVLLLRGRGLSPDSRSPSPPHSDSWPSSTSEHHDQGGQGGQSVRAMHQARLISYTLHLIIFYHTAFWKLKMITLLQPHSEMGKEHIVLNIKTYIRTDQYRIFFRQSSYLLSIHFKCQ